MANRLETGAQRGAGLIDIAVCLFALAALAGIGWWTIYRSPGNALSLEKTLESQAQAALTAAGIDWATVDMQGQRAVLNGAAPSPDSLSEAAAAVLKSSGDGGLVFGGVTIIESALEDAAPVSPYVWRAIKTDTGKLILTGVVPTRAIQKSLVDDASMLAKGAEVSDQLTLARGVPAGNWQGMARLGLQQLAQIESGEVRLENTTLTLKGIALDDAIRARVSADVANVTAPYRGEPIVRGASLWTAVHRDGALILAGKVKSDGEKREIARIAKAYYAREVRDEMTVAADGPADWIDGVRLGLPHFAAFRSGQMDFDPKGAGFVFEGEASGSTLAYLREDMAKLTGPYRVALAAKPVQVAVAETAGIDFTGDPKTACANAFARQYG
jgi:OmpA-OmpF porin, OOP family